MIYKCQYTLKYRYLCVYTIYYSYMISCFATIYQSQWKWTICSYFILISFFIFFFFICGHLLSIPSVFIHFFFFLLHAWLIFVIDFKNWIKFPGIWNDLTQYFIYITCTWLNSGNIIVILMVMWRFSLRAFNI